LAGHEGLADELNWKSNQQYAGAPDRSAGLLFSVTDFFGDARLCANAKANAGASACAAAKTKTNSDAKADADSRI